MIPEQKKLLAQIQAAEKAASGMLGKGLKIGGVVRALRDASDELAARVRFAERTEPKAKTGADAK